MSASATQYAVQIDTSLVEGNEGAIVFDLTSNNPGIGSFNTVSILDFTHDGTSGLPETRGGLVEGDIILLLNPAPFTDMDDGFFFNELLVPFSSFGTEVTFTLLFTEVAPETGEIPTQFALFILGDDRKPLFPTGDPLGSDALFTIDSDGTQAGLMSAFSPTEFSDPDLLSIVVPSGQGADSDGDGIPDVSDNCPDIANPDQADADSDTVGDACDNCVNTANTDQADGDSNGIGDACQVSLTIDVQGTGTTNPAQGTSVHESGTQVTLTATPATGWTFDRWEGAVADATAQSTTILLDDDQTVTAFFEEESTEPIGCFAGLGDKERPGSSGDWATLAAVFLALLLWSRFFSAPARKNT